MAGKMTTNSTLFDDLPDDVLGKMLLFCPFPSAVHFVRGTCKSLRHRSLQLSQFWKVFYHRHGFFPSEEPHDQTDYLMLGIKKCQLMQNQCSGPEGEGQQSLSLPDRRFHFRPFCSSQHDNCTVRIPRPEIFFDPTFALISGGMSPELLLLNTFDGSLSVFQDCYRPLKRTDTDSRYPPLQCLLPGNEFSEVDLISNYFLRHDRGFITEKFDMRIGDLDSTPILRPSELNSHRLEGYLVGIGRCFVNMDDGGISCSEFTTWTRSMTPESTFGNRRVCRLPLLYDTAAVDACHLRVLLTTSEQDYCTILVYPLIDWQGEDVGSNSKDLYFPKSLFSIDCQDLIRAFSLDATGETLIAATDNGDIEIWTVGLETAHRQHVVSFLSQPSWILELELTRRIFQARYDGETDFATSINERGEEIVEKPVFRAFQPEVIRILLPKHLPVQQSGFVTFHRDCKNGFCLLLWKLVKDSWQVVSLIDLKMAYGPCPTMTYDGRSILVFGEANGPILLIYHVLNSDSVDAYDGGHPMGDAFEGGVYNMVKPHVVRLVKRVRHFGMGGMVGLDYLFMTSNERFIVLPTRRGDRLGTSPLGNGILVIDLEDH